MKNLIIKLIILFNIMVFIGIYVGLPVSNSIYLAIPITLFIGMVLFALKDDFEL